MRYHWGLAVGHAYTHGDLEVDPSRSTDGASNRDEDDYMDAGGSVGTPEDEPEDGRATIPESDEEGGSVVILDNEEEGNDGESGDYVDEEDISDPGEDDDDDDDDEANVALLEMYGESNDIEYYQ